MDISWYDSDEAERELAARAQGLPSWLCVSLLVRWAIVVRTFLANAPRLTDAETDMIDSIIELAAADAGYVIQNRYDREQKSDLERRLTELEESQRSGGDDFTWAILTIVRAAATASHDSATFAPSQLERIPYYIHQAIYFALYDANRLPEPCPIDLPATIDGREIFLGRKLQVDLVTCYFLFQFNRDIEALESLTSTADDFPLGDFEWNQHFRSNYNITMV